VPPHAVELAEFWPNARDGFDALFRACAAQSECRERHPQLEDTFTNLVRALEARPIETAVADTLNHKPERVLLDGGALANWLVNMSFETRSYKYVPAWIGELAAGEPRNVAESWLERAIPPGYVGYGLMYGVVCSE
jgi:hypothetical protein